MTAVLAVALAVVTGCLAVRLVRPGGGLAPRWAALMLEISLGAGVGVALSSTVFFLLLVAGAASRWVVLSVELALLAGLAVLLYVRHKGETEAEPKPVAPPVPGFRWNGLLIVVLAVALLFVLAAQVDMVRSSPHGNWDAFSGWNVRAKLLLGPGDAWKNAVSPLLERTHPEYPLLLPAFIARNWRLAGDATSPAAPLATAFLFFGSVMALLFSSLVLLRSLSSGLLACLIIIATTRFMGQTTWQYADIPAGFYYLATLVLVLLSGVRSGRGRAALLAIAGACASFAALTKNEGLVFVVISIGAYFVITWRTEGMKQSLERARYLIAAAAPGLLILGCYKLFLAPAMTSFGDQTASQLLGKLGDPARYKAVIGAAFSEGVSLGGGFGHPLVLLAVLAFVLRFDVDRRLRAPLLVAALTVGLVFILCIAARLLAPEHPPWHPVEPMTLLYGQIWPSVVLLAFMVLNSVQDPASPASAAEKASPGKRKDRSRKRGH